MKGEVWGRRQDLTQSGSLVPWRRERNRHSVSGIFKGSHLCANDHAVAARRGGDVLFIVVVSDR